MLSVTSKERLSKNMAARKKTSTKPKSKPKATTSVRKRDKKKINVGGEVGPIAWIVVAVIIGYLGWAASRVGMG